MDFFLKHDWLDRGYDSYAFKLDHLLFIVIAMAIGITLAILLRGKKKRTIEIVMISLWGLGLISEIFYYSFLYYLSNTDPSHPFNMAYDLPLHSCLMFFYIFPFAIFIKNKFVKTACSNFLVVVNMIMGFITLFVGCPSPGYAALSFFGFQTLLYHSIIVIVPFIMIFTNYYDLKKWDIKYGMILFAALSIIMWTFDAIAGCDYFYFYDGHTFPILHNISDNVPHIVWTLLIVSCYVITAFIIHFLVYYVKFFYSKHKQKQDNSLKE